MLLLVALSAIIIPLALLVVLRLPARYGMPIAALAVALLASSVWGMQGLALSASALQGIHRALTILWILLGAILFLSVMQQSGSIERIKYSLMKVTEDMRVQVVLVAFCFIAIIEGVSGFGTPSAIAVPLLMALGLRPLASVALALIGDSVSTSFGAIGTPVLVGLSNIDAVNQTAVGTTVTIIDALFAVLLPILLVSVLVLQFGRHSNRLKDIGEMLPWSLMIGGIYAATAYISVRLIGVEFVSVVSGIVALLFAVVTAKYDVITPKTIWRHHENDEPLPIVRSRAMSSSLAWLPYGLIVAALLLQRSIPAIKDASTSLIDLTWNDILGVADINSAWSVLYSPGTTLLAVALVVMIIHRLPLSLIKQSMLMTVKTLSIAAMSLVPTLIMVQVFANSGLNATGLASMPVYIAEVCAAYLAPVWMIIAPVLGTIVAFVTGSSTVSTLTMSPIQYSVASQLSVPTQLALAQQISGANAGNIIAIHNVVAASTVAGLHHQEGRIIHRVLPMVGVYLVCSIVCAWLYLSLFS